MPNYFEVRAEQFVATNNVLSQQFELFIMSLIWAYINSMNTNCLQMKSEAYWLDSFAGWRAPDVWKCR